MEHSRLKERAPSTSKTDVVVLGGGVNGLVAATWLARRGRSVRLFERAPQLGGLCASHELHPAYHTNGTLVETDCFPAVLASELELERHGLRWRAQEPALQVAGSEGEPYVLHAELEPALAAMPEPDAAAYARWREQLARWRPFVERVLLDAPPDLDAADWSGNLALASTGFALRRLGERDMVELLRSAPLALTDWLAESFESDALKVALAAPALEGAWFGPRGAGGAALLLAHAARRGRSVAGGARALVAALAAAARAAGAELECGREIEGVELGPDGVRAVALADGERVECGALLATSSARQVLLELLPPTAIAPSLSDAAHAMRARGTVAVLDVALSAPFEIGASPRADTAERVVTAPHLDALERAADAPKYDECAERPWLSIACPSLEDPELCPAGHAVLTALVHTAPRALRGGWTDEARDTTARRALEELFRVAPAAREHLVAQRLRTPVELESELRLPGGHLHQLEPALDQLLVARPCAACAQYATPVPGLFLGGRGSHPGGRTSGAEGHLAARALTRQADRARRARRWPTAAQG